MRGGRKKEWEKGAVARKFWEEGGGRRQEYDAEITEMPL
jgi:hypothetical protein